MEIIKATSFVIKENYQNRKIILPLAKTSIKKTNAGSTLGQWWVLIRDALYFIAFTFMSIIMGGRGIQQDGMNQLVFIATGMVPFFIFTDMLAIGSSAIKMNSSIVTKMKFPITVVPVFEATAIFLTRFQSIGIMFVIVMFIEGLANFNPLYFAYYLFSAFVLCIAMNFLFSALATISKDFQEVLFSILRILMFFVPIMWPMAFVAQWPVAQFIIMLNPMIYIIEGFRQALSTGAGNTLPYTIYFWTLTVAVFMIGSYLQYKLRKIYADVM